MAEYDAMGMWAWIWMDVSIVSVVVIFEVDQLSVLTELEGRWEILD